ncbi:MAG: hypothetical protein GXN93_01125 [Candidatus Diapherotrites archaeon]|nr:hypothetical protein [Candidatus Diapherotrites archaeon]
MSVPTERTQCRPLEFHRTPWVIVNFLRGWQMDVLATSRRDVSDMVAADPQAFLEGVRHKIRKKLEEEIRDLGGVKFQLALKVALRKTGPDGDSSPGQRD